MHQQNFVCLQKKVSWRSNKVRRFVLQYQQTSLKLEKGGWNFCCRCDLLFSLMKICPSILSRCGLPVCNEACEKGHLHGNYECAIFAQAFDREGKDQKRKMPAIENMYAPCPLYTCITPLRFLLRQQRAKESKEKVGLKSCL